MKKFSYQPEIPSDDQLNQQINDKLSELWTGMRNKKKQLLRNLTPSYSRRSQLTTSELNAPQNQTCAYNHSVNESQLFKIKQKLASESSERKLKQTQIQKLKNTISQLTNDKKILIRQIQKLKNQSTNINQLKNLIEDHQQIDGKTANFYPQEKRKKSNDIFINNKDKSYFTEGSNKENKTQNQTRAENSGFSEKQQCKLEDLTKARLVELLRSTSEYREFVFYYDSHELSYLKRLQNQHKKNCQIDYSLTEKRYWAETQLCERMNQANLKNKWGLNQTQIEQIISQMKGYFELNEEIKVRDTKEYYLKKIQKLKREKQNKIPYDIVRLSNAKEREICRKKIKSIKVLF